MTRTCSECPNAIPTQRGNRALTCSSTCSNTRAKRLHSDRITRYHKTDKGRAALQRAQETYRKNNPQIYRDANARLHQRRKRAQAQD